VPKIYTFTLPSLEISVGEINAKIGSMSASWCRVSFQDRDHIAHVIDVLATSLYEAIALAVHGLKNCPFPVSNFDAATQATVELLPESKGTTHMLDLGTVYNYARSNAVLSPADMVKRDRIRKLLNFE
jgi:hypothetical protein